MFFSQINVVTSHDESEVISIAECKDVLNNCELKINLSSIASNFLRYIFNRQKIGNAGVSHYVACQLVSELEQEFGKLYDKRYSVKLASVFSREKWKFSILKEVDRILTGRTKETDNEFIKTFSCSDLTALYTPLHECKKVCPCM